MRKGFSRWLQSLWYGRGRRVWLLRPLELVYLVLCRRRRSLYLSGRRKVVRLPVPVLVVGNITVGGTGKTPLTIWLADALRTRGLRCGIVSRGYRGRSSVWPLQVLADTDPDLAGDEPVLLARNTDVPVVVAPDRVAAARVLMETEAVDVIIADDGLQHYRLGRDFEIAVVDGVRGFGNGHCLPAGPLREPLSRLQSVQALVVNGGSGEVAAPGVKVPVYRAAMAPGAVHALVGNQSCGLSSFAGSRVHAVAGIGRPDAFFAMLREHDIDVIAHAFDDHARLEAGQLEFGDALPVLMTEKDAVKCHAFARRGLWYVSAQLQFADDDGRRLIDSVCATLQSH
jgi:tetraacyldisaccharide 4'-kinase